MESQYANSLHVSATDWSIPGIMGKSSTISERGRGSERAIIPVLTKSEQLSRTGTETTEREYVDNCKCVVVTDCGIGGVAKNRGKEN